MAISKVTGYRKAGTVVCVLPKKMPHGRGLSYTKFCGRLVEPGRIGPAAGWDVVDIETSHGIRSVYAFSVRQAVKRRRSRRR